MAKVISIMNEKGGVGKTATATTLAYLLAHRGHKTALIDFDGQGSASVIMGAEPNKLTTTISTIMNAVISGSELPRVSDYLIHCKNGVDLIPANSELFALTQNLCNADFREGKLRTYIDTIKSNYDFIVIDCMPQIGPPMINAMLASDYIVVPTQAEILSAQGLGLLIKHITALRKNSGHNVKIAGILITMEVGKTIVAAQVREMIKSSFGNSISVFKTAIPRSIKVAEACLYAQTISEYQPNNAAAIAYDKFVEELLETICNSNEA